MTLTWPSQAKLGLSLGDSSQEASKLVQVNYPEKNRQLQPESLPHPSGL